jgi:isoleucyl-tRNA synthetase
MTASTDLKSTLNLPQTTFPMKANLPQAEPKRLEAWKAAALYGPVRAAREGAPKYVLHDGPPYANGNIHLGTALNKILKDVVVRSRSLAGFDSPYVPGWDCHGLPIELRVDKDLGAKKRDMSPVAFRQACRKYAEKYLEIQRAEFIRLGVMGDWERPYRTMDPSYQATIVRELAAFAERGLVYKAKKSVHWCITDRTALAEAEVEYDEGHVSPSIDVRFPLADGEAARLGLPAGARVSAVIWTTTPWTLPANLALAFHPDADYGVYEVTGAPSELIVVARALREAAQARWNAKDGSGVTLGAEVAERKGAAFEGARFRHPWVDRDSKGVLGDYVTLDTGTGVVHTAPGHGWDDYLTGVKYGLDIYCPVDEAGRFLPEVEHFAGLKVFEANPKVIAFLRERGALLSSGQEKHSYPVCWRCKNPIIFRATPQWFIAMDGPQDLRGRTLTAIDTQVKWHPAWGRDRIYNMIAGRPDWCISRQRLWGVPIPAFYCEPCGEALLSPELVRRVADVFETESADAWYDRDASAFLPEGFECPKCGGRTFTKETDILDVWFDSGSSHAAVLSREGLRWPADVYLEGSDQHRGWFHSSLLIGMGAHDAPPYRNVVTHGFTVDAQGRKMSKSLGNVIEPQKVWDKYGAEVLRLWVCMVDYREDMPVSDAMFQQVAEAYRKLRNTCRYLLSNLYDYDPAADAVAEADLAELDRYALARHRQVVARVLQAYDEFEFHLVYHQLVQYCAADLSSFYLDVLKDRLYCEAAAGRKRRSAQTVLHRIATDLTLLMAPVLPFTSDEVWPLIPGRAGTQVHAAAFPSKEAADEALLQRWEPLLEVRSAVHKALEVERAQERIKSGLEAGVTVTAPAETFARLRDYESQDRAFPGNLASLFIVSRVVLEEGRGLEVEVARAKGGKCDRCWTYSEQVGRLDDARAVCERCAEVLQVAVGAGGR